MNEAFSPECVSNSDLAENKSLVDMIIAAKAQHKKMPNQWVQINPKIKQK
jgi:hypothetical protein